MSKKPPRPGKALARILKTQAQIAIECQTRAGDDAKPSPKLNDALGRIRADVRASADEIKALLDHLHMLAAGAGSRSDRCHAEAQLLEQAANAILAGAIEAMREKGLETIRGESWELSVVDAGKEITLDPIALENEAPELVTRRSVPQVLEAELDKAIAAGRPLKSVQITPRFELSCKVIRTVNPEGVQA